MPDRITSLLATARAGWSLPQDFYSAPDVYAADLAQVWRRGWLFAGHACEIPRVGDYFTLEVDTDSLLIIRSGANTFHALHNVCRHRGSQICDGTSGHAGRLVCPYHQWAYGLDGALLACRGMEEDLDRRQFSLKSVHLAEVEGLLFISLAERPSSFDAVRTAWTALLKPQGFPRARVARSADYLVKANWKIVWENNRECYHCNQNHPQYIRANFDHYNADDTTPAIRAQIQAAVAAGEQKWASAGLAATHTQTGMTVFPDAANNIWYSGNRTPLIDGYLSETMDGRPVAPLMGDYPDADVGTLRLRSLPNFWNHSSCDHAVSTRLLPAGPQLTAIRVWWLVDEKAVEGRDYDPARLMPFWQLTSEQDWVICERQQRGINSSAYVPGPYSKYKEYNVDSFVRWYLQSLSPSHTHA